jgi:small subunit ribosomal protein S9
MFVNSKSLDEYFGGHQRQKSAVMSAMKVTQPLNNFDVHITALGGGVNGQADAIRLGLARALVSMDEKYRTILRKHGFLTRDPRMVERKKSGQPKARRRFQHSKR